jgi:hypothetical protein
LNVSYAAGPGPVRVHMQLEFEYTTKNIWNVIGTIKGHVEPDRLVIIGTVTLFVLCTSVLFMSALISTPHSTRR